MSSDTTNAAGPRRRSSSPAIAAIAYAVIGAVLVTAFTWYAGTGGIYLFDESIGLVSGWLVTNGWVPFRDFTTPLMPLNAVLVAAAYELLGVRYLSTVIVTTILAAITFLIAFHSARRLVSSHVAFFCVLTGTLTTLPAFGSLYYNHMLSAILMLHGFLALNLISQERDREDPEIKLRLGIGLLIMLSFLTKFQVGSLFLALQATLELCLYFTSKKRSFKSLLVSLALIGTPTLIALLTLAAWIDFDYALILQNLGISRLANQVPLIQQQIVRAFGGAVNILEVQHVSPLLVALLLGSAAYVFWREGWRSWTDFLHYGFALAFLAAEQLSFVASAETPAVHSSAYVVVFVALLHRAPDRHRALLIAMLMSLVAALLIFAITYNVRVLRKSWSETHFAFELMPRANMSTRMPFFDGVHLQREHAVVLDRLAALKAKHPDARIMYGRGLEAFFPVTGDLPPLGWPNWFHPGLSYRVETAPRLRALFMRERYDYVLVVNRREETLTPSLARFYQPCERMAAWATLYCRNGNNASVAPPNSPTGA